MYHQTTSEIQADGLHTLYLMNPNSAAVILHAPPPLLQQQDFPAISRTWGLNDQPQQTPRALSLSLSAQIKSSVAGDHNFPPTLSSSPSEPNSVIMGSKYLKAVQELLDEVVNVGKEATKEKGKMVKDKKLAGDETAIRRELSEAEKQEIQMKRSKLNSMLDEVEQRCRQYQEQMQIVVAAFEQVAGMGSATAYTHLPQKTILNQFRCLKSTISAQIKGLNKTLGDDEQRIIQGLNSRFRLVESEPRLQNNAWRPHRGLPQRAVSVLRAWLFDHFLHPYPKDLDKKLLATQTGLTRSQVSNWFINARVRVWKPMVEEMYLQETNNQNKISDATKGATPSPPVELSASAITTTASASGSSNFAHLITSLNTDNLQSENNPKRPRNAVNLSTGNQMTVAGDQTKFTAENYLSMAAANSFSLSLALQPAESSQFLSHRSFQVGDGGNMGYEILDFHNRKPFPERRLPDFVA